MSEPTMSIEALVAKKKDEFFNYLAIPTISAQKKGIPETVAYVKQMVTSRGGEVTVLDDLGGNPVICAHFAATKDAQSKPTLLFYNHYDVQPADPLDEWLSEPFSPEIRDGNLYCRGVADNKGNLMSRLLAIDYLNQSPEGLGCNVKFLIEGEEEIGSPHLELYLKKYADLFKADGCIWEFGGKQADESFVIDCGIKGMIYMELTCKTADIDAHSSLAAVLDNAAWRLVQGLATLKSVSNEILIDGFYDEVKKPTDTEVEKALSIPVSAATFVKNYGMKRSFITETLPETPEYAFAFSPTLTVNGFLSGYIDEGSKTVLPKQAMAKLESRLVPDQTPEHIYASLRAHLDRHGFDDIDIEIINGQRAYRSDMDSPFIHLVEETAKAVYEPASKVLVRPNNAGTGPMYIFGQYLGVPVASAGAGWAKSQAHAPNESIRLKDFDQAIAHIVALIQGMSAIESR